MRPSAILLAALTCFSLAACTPPPANQTPNLNGYGSVIDKGSTDSKDHGKQTAMWYGAIAGINGTNANGVGFVRTYEDGTSSITLNLNILPAPKGTSYTASLSNAATKQKVDLGELRSIVGDARHASALDTKEDVSAMHDVQVFLDGKVIAEGTLKESEPAQQ